MEICQPGMLGFPEGISFPSNPFSAGVKSPNQPTCLMRGDLPPGSDGYKMDVPKILKSQHAWLRFASSKSWKKTDSPNGGEFHGDLPC